MGEAAETCDAECSPTGRCDPKHPIHCCHVVVSRVVRITGVRRKGFICMKCTKVSRTWVPLRAQDNGNQVAI